MKALVVLTASIMLLVGTTLTSAKSARQPAGLQHPVHLAALSSLRLPTLGHLKMRWGSRTLQTGGTSTPTAVPVPTATAVPPCTSCPDATTLLQKTIQVYDQIQYAHFVITTDGEETGVEHLLITATGDASCKGPSMTVHVVASDSVEGTQQSTKVNEYFIQIKNTIYTKTMKTTLARFLAPAKPAGKNGVWAKSKQHRVIIFKAFPVDNPLICPSATTGGGSGTSGSGTTDQLKNLVDLGADTFQGNPVWHLRGTDVSVDPSGKTSEAQLDFLVSQDHFLPYVFSVTVVDPTQNITVVQKQVLTQFGKKVSIKAPKVGSTKP